MTPAQRRFREATVLDCGPALHSEEALRNEVYAHYDFDDERTIARDMVYWRQGIHAFVDRVIYKYIDASANIDGSPSSGPFERPDWEEPRNSSAITRRPWNYTDV